MNFSEIKRLDLPHEAYRAIPAWSISQLKLLPQNPEEFEGLYLSDPPRWVKEESPAMRFGTMAHARLLEPDFFAERYPQAEQCSGVLKSGKNAGERCTSTGSYRDSAGAWYCGVHAKGTSALPVQCLGGDDAGRLNSIVRSCYANKVISEILPCPGETEFSLQAVCQGLRVKGRLDKWWFNVGNNRATILDLKTTVIDPRDSRLVGRQFLGMGYHRQAAWYCDLLTGLLGVPIQFVFLAVKTTIPFNAVLWTLGERELELGRQQNDEAIENLIARLETNNWTSETTGKVNPLCYPDYAFTSNLIPFEEFNDYE